jgi:hypothetical protein
MRLNTLATAMFKELIEFEGYFAFKENLLVLSSFFDILKSSFSPSKFRENAQLITDNNFECEIINVKFNFAPSIEDVISKLIRLLNSESHLIAYINDSDHRHILILLDLSNFALKFLEIIHIYDSESNVPKHRLKSALNRCKIAKLVLQIISRFQELAGPELSYSFKIYKTLKHSLKRNVLIGGIIYFLFIICFETLTPGLNEFVRLSLKDLDNILELNPSLNYFYPELNLIRSVLALNYRSDHYAIDCLLHSFIFDIKDLNMDFIYILKSFLNISSFKEIEIAVKLIQKFGNQNLVQLFLKSYETLKHANFKYPIELNAKTKSASNLNDINLDIAQSWLKDFDNYLRVEEAGI